MNGSRTKRIFLLLLGTVLLAGCASSPHSPPPAVSPSPPRLFYLPPRPRPTPEVVSLGIATWNIERFDGAGEGDDTPPTRTARHLGMIAQVLLDTGAAIIGLEEISRDSSFSDLSPYRQIVNALNELEEKRRKKKLSSPVWRGKIGESEGVPSNVALLWNDEVVEARAVEELKDLRVGYTGIRGLTTTEELRFPRIPLAGRFRLRRVPDFDLTVIVLHLKAMDGGFGQILDVNDIRRRGELEDLLHKWVLNPAAQGELEDEEIVILGDMNESGSDLVRLLDEFGTRPESKGILNLYPDALPPDRLAFLFADARLDSRRDYTYMGNSEKDSVSYRGEVNRRDQVWSDSRAFIDHILISAPLVGKWDGRPRVHYFERRYSLHDHVHFSDHRPLSIKLLIPVGSPPARASR